MVVMYLSDAGTIITTSKRLQSIFSPYREVLWTPDGFEPEEFFPGPRSGDIKIGWSGSRKVLYDILLPAIGTDFELKIAGGDLEHGNMRDFYNSIDVLCVASVAEGAPLPLLEGMDCGCYPVCVDVGIVPELVTHLENGLIIDRNIGAFRAAFQWCRLNIELVRKAGLKNVIAVQKERTWYQVSSYWREAFRHVLSHLNQTTKKLNSSTAESQFSKYPEKKENVLQFPSGITKIDTSDMQIRTMNKDKNCIIVTIDTECDKSRDWRTSSPLTFRGVKEAVPNVLQPLFSEFGIRPTYPLSPEVICNPECCSVSREINNAELGAHLHGDYIVPQIKSWNFAGSLTDDMQWEYSPGLERTKLETLTELFIQQFGFRPTSFRAGRYGISNYTGKWLQELGYLVDTSVTPHLIWTSRNGRTFPNFKNAPELPYRIGANGDIWKIGKSHLLEVPMTILKTPKINSSTQNEAIWFRPWSSDAETMCNVIKYVATQSILEGRGRPLVMMFHNVELVPGASPRLQTDSDVIRYLDILKRTFELAEKMEITSYTLSEYYHKFFQEAESSTDLTLILERLLPGMKFHKGTVAGLK